MGSGTGPVLSEAEVQDMRTLEPSRRNRLLLWLLYSTGLRPAELCALCWRDLQESTDTGQLIIVGPGGQLRLVPLRTLVWEELQAFRGRAGDLEPILPSRRGGHLSSKQVERLVRTAATRVHIKHPVSPRLVRYVRPRA